MLLILSASILIIKSTVVRAKGWAGFIDLWGQRKASPLKASSKAFWGLMV